jgi:DnaJ family protein C protein 7
MERPLQANRIETATDIDIEIIDVVGESATSNAKKLAELKRERGKIETATEIDIEIIDDVGETARSNAKKLAELKRERGKQLFITKQYQQAIQSYTEAIELCPDSSVYYGNRAACYIMLYQYKDALEDARKAVALDSSFVKGYIRIAKCSLALGYLPAANGALCTVKELSLNNFPIPPEVQELEEVMKYDMEGTIACHKQNYIRAVFCTDKILKHIPCTRYKLKKAGCLILLGRYQEARNITNDILHADKQNVEAVYVRGMCFYYEGNTEEALCHFKYVLRLAPNHQRAMATYMRTKALLKRKEDGNIAYAAGRLGEAYSIYTEALGIDPTNKSINAKLFYNRAMVYSRMGRFNEATADCSSALKLDENYRKALLQRAKCYMALNDFEKAVEDYEKAFKMDKSQESRRLLNGAKVALEKSKCNNNYYDIVGVKNNATINEIRKAYKRKALDYHPDRHVDASEDERIEYKRKFQEIGQAYQVLTDPNKRARYDMGLPNSGFGRHTR